MIKITDGAKNKFLAILENEEKHGQGLRVTAKRGMSPFSVDYGLAFVAKEDAHPADKVFKFDGFEVYVDPDSAPFLDGAVVDYVSGLNESGFKITNPKTAQPAAPTGPLAEKVQQVLETRVNPAVRSHGGMVSLIDVRDEVAYLKFGGGCQGCGMVDVTLKQGVEVMLKESVPELRGVMDVTDHAGGTNPYYQAEK